MMKVDFYFAFSLLLLMTSFVTVAKPADPRAKEYVQPDGRVITVQLRGDERHHYYMTEDGCLLTRKSDAFFYADVDERGALVSSGILASESGERDVKAIEYLQKIDKAKALERLYQKAPSKYTRHQAPASASVYPQGYGLFPGSDFPVAGSPKVLVILVEYTDVKFELEDPYEYFSRLLTESGFNAYGGTGSVYDYFLENSLGEFTPQFDLYGPVTISHNRAYYGANDIWGSDMRPEQMIIEACQGLDDKVDFAQYDNDGDGVVDNVYVFYAGEGEASGASSDTVWPHSWNITNVQTTPVIVDGVKLDRYACSNEWERNRPDGIGTFVHEFSHVMGLPDLYATSYNSSFTPGAWSALDYGPYNNNGCTPPAYGAFERYALGWIEPLELDGPMNVTLSHVLDNEACVIHTSTPTEFFLFENRQQTSWDAYIPGHGMLVWHIDYNAHDWDSNVVNNNPSHQRVDIVEADGSESATSRDGDAFPGVSGATSFTDTTHPAMVTWKKEKLGLPITAIKESGGIISFLVAGGLSDLDIPQISEVSGVCDDAFTISWTIDPEAVGYIVNVYTKGEDDKRNYVNGWKSTEVGCTDHAVITGLTPLTTYYCTLVADDGVTFTAESAEMAVTTSAPTFKYLAPEALDATDVTSNSFIANWQLMDGAIDYYINVYVKDEKADNTEVCDFANGVNHLPDGWSTNSSQSYATSAFSGEFPPSLRLSTAGSYICTPVYDSAITSIAFWHRGSAVPSSNHIKVMALVDGNYEEVEDVNIVNKSGGAITTIDYLPTGTHAVRLDYIIEENGGALAIDDILVTLDHHYSLEILPDYASKAVGDITTYEVNNLMPATSYVYEVYAYDGEVYSKVSNDIAVTTLEQASLSSINMTAVVMEGQNIRVEAKPHQAIMVYDVLGRLVAAREAGDDGLVSVTLPSKGIYMLKVAGKTFKLKI